MRSIRQQLLIGLFCGALLCIAGAGVGLYRAVREEASELSDMQLRQIAVTLPDQLSGINGARVVEDPEEEFVVQAWSDRGALIYASRPDAVQPRYLANGYATVQRDGQRWRIYSVERRGQLVQVAQSLATRDGLAAKLALRIVLPLLLMIPLLGGLIYLVVGRALRPLHQVARAVAGRSPQALQPLELAPMSPELRPIVDALNGLLLKIAEAMTAQRRFVADAAHELRSPLTALKLQLQLAERADGDAARAAAHAKLHERLDRSSHLVQQLLTLARHEPDQVPQAAAPVDLCALVQTAVGDHSTLAESRNIDLGAALAAITIAVNGHADALAVLLNNLVDNALRYTQPGGQVDVSAAVEEGRAVLRVADNGPGIAPGQVPRVFDRFYRPDGNQAWGSGLGLAIVKNIAELHGAAIRLGPGLDGAGLTVTIAFP
ncbi:ATP-binding protein [Rugamonas sp.]|uniref:ATP-binding protein n=1 Tax=Rugamonas sp. TaxID=1926287 RepID=UPI0025FFF5D9|nr:ATP-binding protein [Rugamonas sp.]